MSSEPPTGSRSRPASRPTPKPRSTPEPLPRTLRLAFGLLLLWSLALRLCFGAVDLHGGRFWDERYGLENIHGLIVAGELEPANGYHPTLSYLPQAALLGAVEVLHRLSGMSALAIHDEALAARAAAAGGDPRVGGFTPLAYFLCRLLQALFGTASIAIVFCLGRRLFAAAFPHGSTAPALAGLAAALLLAASPWHVRQSAIFKPDILLLLTTLLAFLWSLRALEKPGLGRYLLAGLGIGLALASKYNGGPIALPLAFGAAILGFRDRRHWRGLVAAGLSAAAFFLVLHPFLLIRPGLYQQDFGQTLRHYERKASDAEVEAPLPAHAVVTLLSPNFLGPWLGGFALAAFGLLALQALRVRGLWVFFVYPLAYPLLYTLSTDNPSPHNWLTLLPFATLAAGWLAARAGASLARVHRPLALAAAGLAALLVAAPTTATIYRYRVPQTLDLALERLSRELAPLAGRWVVLMAPPGSDLDLERLPQSLRRKPGERAAVVPVRAEGAFDDEILRAADGLILLGGSEAPAGPRWESSWRIAPRLFRSRGPSVQVRVRPWVRAGTQLLYRGEVNPEGGAAASLAIPWPFGAATNETTTETTTETTAETRVSFQVRASAPTRPPRARVDEAREGASGRALPLAAAGNRHSLSPRFAPPAAGTSLRLRWPDEPAAGTEIVVRSFTWSPP